MKNILVTGASGNMGRAVIAKFLSTGDNVFAAARNPKQDSANTRLHTVAVDLSNESATHAWVSSVIKNNPIDVAVLTAGGFAPGKLQDVGKKEFEEQLNINFYTAYNVVLPVFEHMKEQGRGRIFLFGSKPGSSMSNSRTAVTYGLSKSLIFRLTELLNLEAGKADVITSIVVPSTIDTPENRAAMPDADTSRWVQPSDIADMIYKYSGEEKTNAPHMIDFS